FAEWSVIRLRARGGAVLFEASQHRFEQAWLRMRVRPRISSESLATVRVVKLLINVAEVVKADRNVEHLPKHVRHMTRPLGTGMFFEPDFVIDHGQAIELSVEPFRVGYWCFNLGRGGRFDEKLQIVGTLLGSLDEKLQIVGTLLSSLSSFSL